jgi:hypothetical protein
LRDQAVEAVEAGRIFAVVERSARLSDSLVGETVLQLLDLVLLFEIVLLDLLVFFA